MWGDQGWRLLVQGHARSKWRLTLFVAEPGLCPLDGINQLMGLPVRNGAASPPCCGGAPHSLQGTFVHVTTSSLWNRCKKVLKASASADLFRVVTQPAISWAGTLALSASPAPQGASPLGLLQGLERLFLYQEGGSKQPQDSVILDCFYLTPLFITLITKERIKEELFYWGRLEHNRVECTGGPWEVVMVCRQQKLVYKKDTGYRQYKFV